MSPSAFVTGKSGSTTSSVTFGLRKRDHSVDVDVDLLLGKKLVQGLNVGGGVSGRVAEECSAHAEKPADALTDFSPPSVAVGHAARKVPRGDGQNSAGVDERVLDGSFADPRIVDQRVALTEILEQGIEDDVIALGAVPLPDLLHAKMKNNRAREERDIGDEDTRTGRPWTPARMPIRVAQRRAIDVSVASRFRFLMYSTSR